MTLEKNFLNKILKAQTIKRLLNLTDLNRNRNFYAVKFIGKSQMQTR